MACVTLLVTTQSPYSSYANNDVQQQQSAPPPPSNQSTIIINSLIEAQTALNTLIDNYQRATIDCTFADVPRDLLESKNKELLLEKASTNALFDKSASVETCKTTNRIVRSYLGLTGIGPLVGIEKRIKSGLEYIEPDFFGDYVSEFEEFSQALSKAASLSYTSGVADFDSVNNFPKEEAGDENRDSNSNLQQAKEAIKEAKGNLDRIIIILSNSTE
ncbi:hypothetical protein FRACYDRAFT_196721 [Fragilariopsis cylindrus CCMP1102]|uniref:Uncharacterized protein n=1 Tax=Fragilariopsis cylindrus CCMP1102 TaxID=635003 RepID=A0A1E7ER93_9STRA|nr:hypothetical protein FRACYDRAFT_196721 [Fragilariopsis cylindrus CCMP1102]|eukprot:OEU08349.1 hypothetical protein FRACYDRAFT_196721 [Fragilariopsis cylindrus CCMP1102]